MTTGVSWGLRVGRGRYVHVAEEVLGGVEDIGQDLEKALSKALDTHGSYASKIADDVGDTDRDLASKLRDEPVDHDKPGDPGDPGEVPTPSASGAGGDGGDEPPPPGSAPPGGSRPEGPGPGRRVDPAELNDAQAKNLRRFQKNVPKGPDGAKPQVEVYETSDGLLHYYARVPGRVPGSYATYNKVVGPDGVTRDAWKDTVAPDGSLVHQKDKMP